MMLVGGCWVPEAGADDIPLATLPVGPEPASLAASVLATASISVVHGPALAGAAKAKIAMLVMINVVFIGVLLPKSNRSVSQICQGT
jgi:hypothetical protein